MPKMKYFQGIADIREQREEMLRQTDSSFKYKEEFLAVFELKEEDLPLIKEEEDAMSYLLGCQTDLAYDYNLYKPSKEILVRCFERRLKYVRNVYIDNKPAMKVPKKLINKKVAVCEYYLAKLEDDAWYNKLPKVILTFANKYPDYNKK